MHPALSISPHKFRAAARGAAIARTSGALVRFILNRPARVKPIIALLEQTRRQELVRLARQTRPAPITGSASPLALSARRELVSLALIGLVIAVLVLSAIAS